jgi:hypothetical protein
VTAFGTSNFTRTGETVTDAEPPVAETKYSEMMDEYKTQSADDLARSLDEQLMTRQPWCTCFNPYFCNGDELNE